MGNCGSAEGRVGKAINIKCHKNIHKANKLIARYASSSRVCVSLSALEGGGERERERRLNFRHLSQ